MGPTGAEPQPAAAPEAAPGRGKKQKTHWSGVTKGQPFTLGVADVPGPNGKKVVVKVQMRRNADDGLTESAEPGWTFKAKGAPRPPSPPRPASSKICGFHSQQKFSPPAARQGVAGWVIGALD